KLGLNRTGLAALIAVGALGLNACGSADAENADTASDSDSAVEVTDMAGDTHEVPADPSPVIATDNRIFSTLPEWDIELLVGTVDLMYDDMEETKNNTDIDDNLNNGNHRNPDMEMVHAAELDLVLNGQRFSQHGAVIAKAIHDNVPIVDTNIETETGEIDQEFRDQISLLGEVFDREDDADALISEFDEALDRAQEAYDSD